MSYPGYPPYNQAPGQQPNQAIPPAYQATAPLSYPIYPGSAAPQPYPYGSSQYPTSYPSYPMPGTQQYPPSYPSQSTPYPGASYPPQPGAIYPGAGQPSASYPGAGQPSATYPGAGQPSATYPGTGQPSATYPGAGQPSATYPGAGQPSATYPGAGQSMHYPSLPPSETRPPYPGGQPYGNGADLPLSSRADYPSTAAYPGAPSSSRPPCPGAVPVYPAVPANNSHSLPASQPKSQGQPTVRPAHPFDARGDAEVLRKAMKGFGTDEKAIIQVLTRRTNAQRQEIAVQFKTLYGKDLISDLKSELSGRFEDLILALMTPISVFLARELHHAMSGIGTNEETLVEVLCSANNYEIHSIRSAYEKVYGASLERELSGDTSGNFRRLLVSLCQGRRSENYTIDVGAAVQDAQALLNAGELQLGTDESTFNAILCSRSYPQLNQVFQEYQRLTGHDFEKVIKREFSGDIESGLLAIVKCVRDRAGFFAEQLHKSMSGMGTKDRALIRIISTRCEIDMADIKLAFQSKYGKTVEDFICGDTSGDYKKALIALIS